MKRTKLYYVGVESAEVGEVGGMFNAKKELLGCWSDNDATWRNEYFAPMMSSLGFHVVDGSADPVMSRKLVEAFSE